MRGLLLPAIVLLSLGCPVTSEPEPMLGGSTSSSGSSSSTGSSSTTNGSESSTDTSTSGPGGSSSSTGASCLPPEPEPFWVETELEPLPPNMIEGTVEGACSVVAAGTRRISMLCEDGATLTVRQTDGTPLDFEAFPNDLQVRAFHRGNGFGSRAAELVLRSSRGELLFAYRYANGLESALDPPWIESLEPLSLQPIDSPCLEEIEYPCVLCMSEALAVSGEGVEGTLLHGGRVLIGPWTLNAPRLWTCEQSCDHGAYPETVIAIVHESVAN